MSITISEIAKMAGVSKTTVSFVLNDTARKHGISEATIKRVKSLADAQGYIPNLAARFLYRGRQQLIAFVAPNTTDFFYSDIAMGIEQEADKHEYQVLFANTFGDMEREKRYVHNLIARRVDGIILLPIDIREKHLQVLIDRKVPTILFRRQGKSRRPFKYMTFDDEASGYLAAKHLLSRGCRNPGLLAIPEEGNTDWLLLIRRARLRGFKKALKETSIPFSAKRVCDFRLDDSGRNAKAETEILRDFIAKNRFDGIAAMSDMFLLRTMNILGELGLRVPKDVKLIGCDDAVYSPFLTPPLSSIRFPREKLGRNMIRDLVAMIEGKGKRTGETLLAPKVSARGSSRR